MPKNKFNYLSDSKKCCSTAGENFSHKSLVEQFFTLSKQRQRSSTCYSDRFLLAVESRYLSQADKSIIRVSSFSILQNFNFWIIKLTKISILPNCQVPNSFFGIIYSSATHHTALRKQTPLYYLCQLEIDHVTQLPKETCERTCRGPKSFQICRVFFCLSVRIARKTLK